MWKQLLVDQELVKLIGANTPSVVSLYVGKSLVGTLRVLLSNAFRDMVQRGSQRRVKIFKPSNVGAVAKLVPTTFAVTCKTYLLQAQTEVRVDANLCASPGMIVSLMISMWSNSYSPATSGIAILVPQQCPQAFDVATTAMAIVVIELFHLELMPENLRLLPPILQMRRACLRALGERWDWFTTPLNC
jgi:cobalamin synthase